MLVNAQPVLEVGAASRGERERGHLFCVREFERSLHDWLLVHN